MRLMKKTLSLTLAVLLLISMLPISVAAEELSCSQIDGCTADTHVEGCALYVVPCTGTDACTASSHADTCQKKINDDLRSKCSQAIGCPATLHKNGCQQEALNACTRLDSCGASVHHEDCAKKLRDDELAKCTHNLECPATVHHSDCQQAALNACTRLADCATSVHHDDCAKKLHDDELAKCTHNLECPATVHHSDCQQAALNACTKLADCATSVHHDDCVKKINDDKLALCNDAANCPAELHKDSCATRCDESLECDAVNHKEACITRCTTALDCPAKTHKDTCEKALAEAALQEELNAKLDALRPYLDVTTITYSEKVAFSSAMEEIGQFCYLNHITGLTKEQQELYDLLSSHLINVVTSGNVSVSVNAGTAETMTWDEAMDIIVDPANASGTVEITLLSAEGASSWKSIKPGYNGTCETIIVNGNNLTLTGRTQPLFSHLDSGIKVEINNLTISGSTIAENYSHSYYAAGAFFGVVENFGTVKLTNCKVLSSTINSTNYAGGLIGYTSGSSVTINNCTASGVTLNAGGSVGTFVGHAASTISVTGTVNGTNSITCTGENGTRPDKAGIVIGRVNGTSATVNVAVSGNNTLSPAGTYTNRIIGSLPSGNAVFTGGEYPANPLELEGTPKPTADGEAVEKNGKWIIAKAVIGANAYYKTLTEAITAASKDDTVKLLANGNGAITIADDLTLNTNGKKVNNTVTVSNGTLTLVGSGDPAITLAISDGVNVTKPTDLTVAAPSGYVWIEDNGSHKLVGQFKRISGTTITYYSTLSAATAAAVEGDTLAFLANYTGNATIGKTLTLDLGDKTLSSTITIPSEIQLTIKGTSTGNSITLGAPTKEGFAFAGWFAGDTAVTNPITTAVADGTIYAPKWNYEVTFDGNGATGGTMTKQTIAVGDTTTLLTENAFTKTGHTFTGWDTQADGKGTDRADKAAANFAANTTLYAQWDANEYTLTFKKDANDSTAYAEIKQDYGTNVTKPTDPTKEGYTFKGWRKSTDAETASATIPTTMPAENITYVAKWEKTKYTITFLKETEDTTPVQQSQLDFGDPITAPTTVPSKKGYTFLGWVDSEDTTATVVDFTNKTVPAKNVTYVAKWQAIGYTIKYNHGTGATGEMDDTTAAYGTYAQLRANTFTPTDSTKRFVGWAKTDNATTAEYAPNAYVLNLNEETDGTVTANKTIELYPVWSTKAVLSLNRTTQSYKYNGYNQEFVCDERFTVSYVSSATRGTNSGVKDVGTYDVVLYFAGDDQYAAFPTTVIPGGLVITPAQLNAAYVSETIYAGTNPKLQVTVTGFKGTDTASNAAGYVAPTVFTDDFTIGKQTLSPAGGKAANYVFTYTAGTLTIKEKVIYVFDPDKLLQTGQLNWPIPVMAALGTAILAAGCWLLMEKKKERNEK